VDMVDCGMGALCSCLVNVAGLAPLCKPCRLSPSPTWSWSREALPSPLPQEGLILLLLLCGLLGHLPVARSEGGVVCGSALIDLHQLLTVHPHRLERCPP
jgi:hypothetical protein